VRGSTRIKIRRVLYHWYNEGVLHVIRKLSFFVIASKLETVLRSFIVQYSVVIFSF